jgi:hypothetical protein
VIARGCSVTFRSWLKVLVAPVPLAAALTAHDQGQPVRGGARQGSAGRQQIVEDPSLSVKARLLVMAIATAFRL